MRILGKVPIHGEKLSTKLNPVAKCVLKIVHLFD